jgi:hypothetical protein
VDPRAWRGVTAMVIRSGRRGPPGVLEPDPRQALAIPGGGCDARRSGRVPDVTSEKLLLEITNIWSAHAWVRSPCGSRRAVLSPPSILGHHANIDTPHLPWESADRGGQLPWSERFAAS